MQTIQKYATTSSNKNSDARKLKARRASRPQRINGRRKSRIYEEYAISSVAEVDWDEAGDLSQIMQTLYVGN